MNEPLQRGYDFAAIWPYVHRDAALQRVLSDDSGPDYDCHIATTATSRVKLETLGE